MVLPLDEARSIVPPRYHRSVGSRNPFVVSGTFVRMIDSIYWIATYTDGTQISEATGGKYRKIDRANLHSFLLRDGQGPLVELSVDGVRSGWNLIYRRRTAITPGIGQKTIYLVGWVPQGPIIAVDSHTYQIAEVPSFIEGHPIFYPPQPSRWEGERWDMTNPTRIVNPAYERTD